MIEGIGTTLDQWHDFYLITGGAAAALTGLQFVVQTLMAAEELRPAVARDPEAGIQAFGTPTVVYFSIALIVSCALTVPWPGTVSLRISLFLIGAGSLAYAAVVLRRTWLQSIYTPEFEDWLWHIILPWLASIAIIVAAVLLDEESVTPMFLTAGACLLLICVGIHNAWDTVTYLMLAALRRGQPQAGTTAPAADVSIRPARPEDTASLGFLGEEMVRSHHVLDEKRFFAATPQTAEGYGRFLASQVGKPDVILFVAERGGRVVGYVYAGMEGKDYMALRDEAGEIYDIVVDPASRRGGVGRMLLQAALDALKSRGAPRVVLSTAQANQNAKRLFEKAGFRRTMIEMTRELD